MYLFSYIIRLLWLTTVYCVTVTLVVVAFGAFRFQADLSLITTNDGAHQVTVSDLVADLERSRRHDAEVSDLLAKIAKKEIQISAQEQNLDDMRQKRADASNAGLALDINIGTEITQTGVHLDNPPSNNDWLDREQFLYSKTNEMNPNDPQLIAKIRAQLDDMRTEILKVNSYDTSLPDMSKRLDEDKVRIGQLKDDLTTTQSETVQPPERSDLTRQYSFFLSVPLGIGAELAVMPPTLLISIVTLTMGALGAVLMLTADMISYDSLRPISWYLFRPLLGAATAFVTLIVVQAGSLVVTQAPHGGSTAPLNPYTIAFIGIISGMFSGRAIERMQKLSEDFFRLDEHPPEQDIRNKDDKDDKDTDGAAVQRNRAPEVERPAART